MSIVMDFQLSLPEPESEVLRSALVSTLHTLQRVFEQATPEDLQAVDRIFSQYAAESVTPLDTARQSLLMRLTEGRQYSALERVALEADNLDRLFELRHTTLAETLTASGVAHLLGSTRQTPYDRAKRGTLLAISDRGALRFPKWQFDPQGPSGVVANLPNVLKALHISPFEKALWLTRQNRTLDGRTPLETLQAGDTQRVLDAAAAVGIV